MTSRRGGSRTTLHAGGPGPSVSHATRVCLALLLVLAPPAAREALALDVQPFEARFEMQARGLVIADVHWRLTRDSGRLVFESTSKATGVAALFSENTIVERSKWSKAGGALLPSHYSYARSGRKKRSLSIDFDRERGRADAMANGKAAHYPMPPGTLDKLSYILAVMQDLDTGARELRYPVATAREVREYVIGVGSRERLETAIGTLDTVRVTRVRKDSRRSTVLWLAPKLAFIPVQIEHVEKDGEKLTVRIVELDR